jgi:hypothetical protein
MRFSFVLAAGLLALRATAALAGAATYDFDSRADFSRFRSFAWEAGEPRPDDFNQQRIARAIESQLAAKRLRRAPRGARPDLLISYRVSLARGARVIGSPGWGSYRFGAGGTARIEPTVDGVLTIEMKDAQRGVVVWRSFAKRSLDLDAEPEKRTRNVEKAVRSALKEYPPET